MSDGHPIYPSIDAVFSLHRANEINDTCHFSTGNTRDRFHIAKFPVMSLYAKLGGAVESKVSVVGRLVYFVN